MPNNPQPMIMCRACIPDVMLLKLLFILKALYNKKRHAEQNGDDKVASQQLALADFRRFHRQYDGNRADDQDGGVDGAHLDVELLASGGEGIEMGEAINQVGAKHAAEEHDFRDQKEPHAERGGVFLLLRVGEVVEQRRVMHFVVSSRDLRRRR